MAIALVAVFYLPFIVPLTAGVVLLVRRARAYSDTSAATTSLGADRVLLASAFGLWVGAVAIAALTFAIVADAFQGIHLQHGAFGLPVTLPVIDSYYPHRPSPAILLVAFAFTAAGLVCGFLGLRRTALPSGQVVHAYLIRTLLPVRAIMIATALFTVVWGLIAGLD